MNKEEKRNLVPIWEKLNLSIEEAAAYTGIGENQLRELSQADDCEFVIWIGSKRLLKRKKLEEFLDKKNSL